MGCGQAPCGSGGAHHRLVIASSFVPGQTGESRWRWVGQRIAGFMDGRSASQKLRAACAMPWRGALITAEAALTPRGAVSACRGSQAKTHLKLQGAAAAAMSRCEEIMMRRRPQNRRGFRDCGRGRGPGRAQKLRASGDHGRKGSARRGAQGGSAQLPADRRAAGLRRGPSQRGRTPGPR